MKVFPEVEVTSEQLFTQVEVNNYISIYQPVNQLPTGESVTNQ